ncbi:MAG: alpha/beta hydrolase [Merismopediaceae bacterium]|nr:alpha/beta hydrolase [Merismopediaceae bacterium]
MGGLTDEQVAKMLAGMTDNYSDWIRIYSPVVMNNPQQPELAEEFAQCLLKSRPDITLVIFSMIILSDCRQEVAKLKTPVLILQPQDDPFVPTQVGEYLHQVIPNSQLRTIYSQGHFPHLSNPTEVIRAIFDYLAIK